MVFRPHDHLEHDLEQHRGQQRHGEGLGDHDGYVLDGQVQHHDVDEHVDDVDRVDHSPARH